jgi:Pectate lyase superfamily protein
MKHLFAVLTLGLASWGQAPGALASTTILAQGCINLKVPSGAGGFLPWSGPAAVGDAITDDTTAFQAAFNNSTVNPGANYYIPTGNYLLGGKLRWPDLASQAHVFGEPSAPPTLILKSNSGISGPFIYVGAHGYTTNNSFCWYFHDFNVTIQSGNAGCTDAIFWATAQCSSARNMVITRQDTSGNCLHQGDNGNGSGGGGVTFQNITCNAPPGATALLEEMTAEVVYRGCTFNGPVINNGNWVSDYLHCTFNRPGNVGFTGNAGWFTSLTNCTFTPGTTLSCSIPYHLENTLGFKQYSSQHVFYNAVSESGTTANLNTLPEITGAVSDPALPEPSSACVNVKSLGVTGNGSTDDTNAIKAALASHSELYFPPGNYVCTSTIDIPAGASLYGCTPGVSGFGTTLYSTAHPGFTVSGAGSGKGVNLVRIELTGSNRGTTNTMIWNGDPSSQIIDTEITTDAPQNAASVNPVIIVQSGGFMYDECDPGLSDTNGNGAKTWMQYNAQGPASLVGCNVEHQAGPTIVINNAANLRIEMMEFEFDVPQPPMPITNSTNICINGTLGGGSSFPSLYSIDKNTTCALWGINIGPGYQVAYNGSNYGTTAPAGSDSLLQGFLLQH